MLPLVIVRLVVKAQVEMMDRCLPRHKENFKHPSMKIIQEFAENCRKQTHIHSHMHVETIVPSWFDVIC